MAGLLGEDYQAVLKALGARPPDTATGGRGGGPRTPSVLDMADLLEPSPSKVHRVTTLGPAEPPLLWDGKLRLMDFDMPFLSRRSDASPENE